MGVYSLKFVVQLNAPIIQFLNEILFNHRLQFAFISCCIKSLIRRSSTTFGEGLLVLRGLVVHVVTSRACTIEFLVSLFISKLLILKTSSINKIHIFLFFFLLGSLSSLYNLCEANLFLEKIVNCALLCIPFSHLTLIQAISRVLFLVVSVLGNIVRCKVLNKFHNLLWIHGVEIPFASCVKGHLINQ